MRLKLNIFYRYILLATYVNYVLNKISLLVKDGQILLYTCNHFVINRQKNLAYLAYLIVNEIQI